MLKKDIRSLYSDLRKEIPEAKFEALNESIRHLFFSRIPVHRYSVIHTYLPIKRNREFDTFALIKILKTDFAPDIFAPIVLNGTELLHNSLNDITELTDNKLFIPEPAIIGALETQKFFETNQKVEILIIVPLLAFDNKGFRVGYGKGFYDRFLGKKTSNCVVVGFSLFEALEEEIMDINSQDCRMDYCITPTKVWHW